MAASFKQEEFSSEAEQLQECVMAEICRLHLSFSRVIFPLSLVCDASTPEHLIDIGCDTSNQKR